ncbi:MAG TPA: 23S rRNA (adenine(2503)-C(2))-methyltransferase RlmN [Candidatus Tumulicola sp.]
MLRKPLEIWAKDLATRSGFAGVDEFRSAFDLKPYRLEQLYRAAIKELAADPSEVTTLPKELRARFAETGVTFSSVRPVLEQRSSDGQTTKVVLALRDGKEVESVLMEHLGGRTTVCISSQAGCAFACAFCSTGQAGFSRHLTPVEIVDQVTYFARELRERGKRITNVVFMGMGEPFHNYDAVIDAISIINDPSGAGLGQRHITVSTVGVVDKIERFADEVSQVNLAISLHAPTDELRGAIMPVNRRFPLAELMAACDRYVRKTGRKVFFEYVMLDGYNDREEDARALAGLMRGHLYHVNLIPYNSTPDAPFSGTSDPRIWEFAAILQKAGVPVTVRYNMGRDIAAACGQLRARTQPRAERAAAAS